MRAADMNGGVHAARQMKRRDEQMSARQPWSCFVLKRGEADLHMDFEVRSEDLSVQTRTWIMTDSTQMPKR